MTLKIIQKSLKIIFYVCFGDTRRFRQTILPLTIQKLKKMFRNLGKGQNYENQNVESQKKNIESVKV